MHYVSTCIPSVCALRFPYQPSVRPIMESSTTERGALLMKLEDHSFKLKDLGLYPVESRWPLQVVLETLSCFRFPPHRLLKSAFRLWMPWAWLFSQHAQADAGICDKAAMLGDTIKGTLAGQVIMTALALLGPQDTCRSDTPLHYSVLMLCILEC